MSALIYVLAYLSILACVGFIVAKVMGYLKKPVHLRWELYPVAHETHGRAAYGGSYLEETNWWQQKQESSLVGAITGFLQEALFLHATLKHNFQLWLRTYPFHVGFYLVVGALGLTVLGAIGKMFGATDTSIFWSLCGNLAQACNLIGFLGILCGALALIQRRLTTPDLRKFSTPEHYFNLGLCALFAALGLLLWLTTPSFYMLGRDFFYNLLTFNFAAPVGAFYGLYLLVSFILTAYIPAAFMGHAFMKYFTYHDIRWGDQPTQDNPAIQAKMAKQLGYPVSWKGPHIKGDGKKTWGEVATTNPTAGDKE